MHATTYRRPGQWGSVMGSDPERMAATLPPCPECGSRERETAPDPDAPEWMPILRVRLLHDATCPVPAKQEAAVIGPAWAAGEAAGTDPVEAAKVAHAEAFDPVPAPPPELVAAWVDEYLPARPGPVAPTPRNVGADGATHYGRTVAAAELGRLSMAEVGCRNAETFRCAVRLVELALAGHLPVAPMLAAVDKVAGEIGLSASERRATIESALRTARERREGTPPDGRAAN